jgi:Asp-tRNA(Asn)/Glu-tRNA(Gln) amidotransferase A subunit family amidase
MTDIRGRRRFLMSVGLAMGGSLLQRRTGIFAATPFVTLSEWMGAGASTRAENVRACLERIRTEDSSIHAWVQVSPEDPTGKGALSGIPFGVKDIIETRGLATELGSPIYKGRVGVADAAIVRDIRQRGAILLGKTHTTAFAYRDPAPTRNPRNLQHTPGGSSSGSAAAVAAGMVPFALGTQTSGSTLRPASYCGVTGFKPTFGLFSLDGVMEYAKSLDTIGFFTHTPEDMLQLWGALGKVTGRDEDFTIGVPDPMPDVEPDMASALREAIVSLRGAGISQRPIDISKMLGQLADAQRVVAACEAAKAHEQRFKEYGDRLGQLAALIREGMQTPDTSYQAAKRLIADSRARLADIYKTTPIIVVPAATGAAPAGLSNTGDNRMNAPWSALGTPAISIPMPVRGPLPLGLQLTAALNDDARLLRAAIRLHRLLVHAK